MKCPHCSSVLSSREAAEVACPVCGGALMGAFAALRQAAQPASSPAAEAFPSQSVARPAGKAKPWVIAALVPVAAAVLAWLLAGHWVWLIVGLLAAAIVAGMLMGIVRGMMEGNFHFDRGGMLSLAYAGGVVALWFGVGYWFQVGTVHIDNFSGQALQVLLDGRPWQTRPAQSTKIEKLTPGKHVITIQDANGQELENLNVNVERQGVYVLNLLGSQKYYKGEVQYGGPAWSVDDTETEISDAWFEPKVDYLFEKPPQSITVSTKRGRPAYSASRNYLRRGSRPK